MSYLRVLPRDLFNESKLLKCMGRLLLLIHDEKIDFIDVDYEGTAFDIHQSSDGDLSIDNLRLLVDGKWIEFYSRYGSKRPYPLYCIDNDGFTYTVFNDDGSLSDEFLKRFKGE